MLVQLAFKILLAHSKRSTSTVRKADGEWPVFLVQLAVEASTLIVRALHRTSKMEPFSRWALSGICSLFLSVIRKCRHWRKRERAGAGIEPTAAAPSQPDCPGVSRSDHSAGSKESASWRALELRSDWHGRLGVGKREKEGKETSRRGSQDKPAQDKEVLRRFVLAASSACFFPSFSLFPTPNRPCQSERSSKARHEADSFEPAEWSEWLTPGQSGWLGAAAVGSIPAPALSLFLQRLYFLLFLQRIRKCTVRSGFKEHRRASPSL